MSAIKQFLFSFSCLLDLIWVLCLIVVGSVTDIVRVEASQYVSVYYESWLSSSNRNKNPAASVLP